MLDPRIYRTGLIAVALAVIVLAFSLQSQPGAMSTSLVPDAFSGLNANATMDALARQAPQRPPGSAGDQRVADYVARTLRNLNFSVSTDSFTARTALGPRRLENVTGVIAGASNSPIVVVAHRDSLRSPAAADLSGTGVLLELARVLSSTSLHHTLVIASTSGATGAAGAAQLARSLARPVQAVLVLGDLAASQPRQPLLVPWSRTQTLAPPALVNTLAGALSIQAQLKPTVEGLGGQLMHLAFPMTVSEQAPFLDNGLPAVLLSLLGERAPAANEATSPQQLNALGRTLLQGVTALDGGGPMSAPSTYLVYAGKMIPYWSIRLLVLALLLPVAMTTVDGLARVRRRGHAVLPGIVWLLACAVAFVLAAGAIELARLVGLLSNAPPGPVPADVGAPHGGGVAAIVIAGVVLVAGLGLLAPLLTRLAGARGFGRGEDGGPNPGAGIAVSVVLCVAAAAMCVSNPFAALLLVPALHLWLWTGAAGWRMPRAVKLLLVLLGAAVPALAVLYYALALQLSPLGVLWNGVLMVAGGQIAGRSVVLWSLVLGCLAGAVVMALRRVQRAEPEAAPITVRGPVSYAGPGSLGGTHSALRR